MANGIVLTNNGEEWVSERMAGVQGAGTNNVFANNGTHIGWGTGTTTPAKADTALQTESGDPATRAATTVTTVSTGSANKYQATATLSSTTTQAITEAGLFSASTAGICFVHSVFSVVNLVSGDSIAFTLQIDPA